MTAQNRYPTHCPGNLHQIRWAIPGKVGVCDGHPRTVWVAAGDNVQGVRLRHEVSSTSVMLAHALIDMIERERVASVPPPAPPRRIPRIQSGPKVSLQKLVEHMPLYADLLPPPEVVDLPPRPVLEEPVPPPAPPRKFPPLERGANSPQEQGAEIMTHSEFMVWYGAQPGFQRDVAAEIGISRGLLCDIISGRRMLGAEVARRCIALKEMNHG